MMNSGLSGSSGHLNTMAWNLSKHAKACGAVFQSNLTSDMIPLMKSFSMTEYMLKRGQCISSHWHPDADELCYVLEGEFSVTIVEPQSTKQDPLCLTTGCVAYIPAGWYHQLVALSDQARFMSIYNAQQPHLIEAVDAWNSVMDLNNQLSSALPATPVFNRRITGVKDQSSQGPDIKSLRQASQPAPPYIAIKS